MFFSKRFVTQTEHVGGNPALRGGLVLVGGSVYEELVEVVGGNNLQQFPPQHAYLVLVHRLVITSRYYHRVL